MANETNEMLPAPIAYDPPVDPRTIVHPQPQYHPNILPIYIAKTDPRFAAAMAEAAARFPPPEMGPIAVANVNELDEPATAPGPYNPAPPAGA